MITSTDGVNWSAVDPGLSHTLYGVTYGNGMFVATTSSGRSLISSTGLSWNNYYSGSSGGLNGVTFQNGRFYACGSTRILDSVWGLSWNTTSQVGVLRDIESLGGELYCVGNSGATNDGAAGVVYHSSDGISWQTVPFLYDATLQAIASGGGVLVAVGSNGEIYRKILDSDFTQLVIGSNGLNYQINPPGAASYSATGLPPGLTLDPTTGVISGIPEIEGPHAMIITTTSPTGVVSTYTLTISVPPLYHWWKGLYYSSADQANLGVSGVAADSDGDGIPTLMEFVLGLDPTAGDGCAIASAILQLGGADYVTLDLRRQKISSAVVIEAEASSAPNFSVVTPAVQVGAPIDNLDGTETSTFRHPAPISGGGRGFLRIRATHPE